LIYWPVSEPEALAAIPCNRNISVVPPIHKCRLDPKNTI
jgi:hypothetical protein